MGLKNITRHKTEDGVLKELTDKKAPLRFRGANIGLWDWAMGLGYRTGLRDWNILPIYLFLNGATILKINIFPEISDIRD